MEVGVENQRFGGIVVNGAEIHSVPTSAIGHREMEGGCPAF